MSGSIWIVEMRGAKLESSAARRVDRLAHLAEDEQPALARLRERVAQDLERDARDLDVHLERGDAVLRAGDLEVHVAEVVLDAGDVGQDRVVVALLDQAHRDAGDRRLQRHARVHQRHRGAADRGHRRGAVGLEDVRHDADRVGERLLRRDHRDQRALGERAVADVAALRAAHEAGLAHRERREVVVVEVALGRLEPEVVQPHLLARRAERDDRQRLRLAAREQRRAVRAREQPDLGLDRADLLLRAAVRALLVDGDALADHVLLELVERELRLARGTRRRSRRRGRRSTGRAPPPRRPWWRSGARSCPARSWPGRAPRRATAGSARRGPRRRREP